jgi:hypothetical protein
MNGSSHEKLTQKIVDIAAGIPGADILLNGRLVSIYRDLLGEKCKTTDDMHDVEFVDVDMGKDDPHVNEYLEDSDEAHYTESVDIDGILEVSENFTAYNHFIDIKKGPGIFDDFDGYSYNRGSARSGQYEAMLGLKIDAAIMYYFNDEYVHSPGQEWYRNCSPAVFRYSYFSDRGTYTSKYQELAKRFPRADNTGTTGKGIPYSVFMPVDNLGRYWYERYLLSGDVSCLGKVLHAVQDCTIPQHVTCYTGNWHREYESRLADQVPVYKETPEFRTNAINYFNQWNRNDPNPPAHITMNDINRIPALNWRIDHLITWVALHAYNSYVHTYNKFSDGFTQNIANMQYLLDIGGAMSMLVLKKASEEVPSIVNTKKVLSISIEHQTSSKNNADTNDNFDLYIYNNICGGSIEMRFPDNPGDDREKGNTDRYSFDVSGYNINADFFQIAIANLGNDGWLPSKIKVTYTTQDGLAHTYANIDPWPNNKYFDGDNIFCHHIPKDRSLPASLKVKKIFFSHITSSRVHADTDGAFLLLLKDTVSNVTIPFPSLDYDEREKRMEDEYTFDVSAYSFHKDELKIGMQNLSNDGWLPKSFHIQIETMDGTRTDFINIPEWPNNRWFDQNDTGISFYWLNG